MTKRTERDEFERWFKSSRLARDNTYSNYPLVRSTDEHEYIYAPVYVAWLAWQAARRRKEQAK